ncbi:MAG: presenilin family intramembrane aspartyl protease [Candidatus Micrarchaeota archaeon]|nr:presenilin family intramembrane aspartyl protease [Candidatus Micrarchaeota archaeon]
MKPYLKIALFFAFVQMLGIYTGAILFEGVKSYPDLSSIAVNPIANQNDPLNALFFIALVLPIFWHPNMERVLESAWPASLGAATLQEKVFFASLMFGTVAGLLLAAAKFASDRIKNAAALISSAGVGALFGFSLGFLPAVLFVILLSIYDYIAVFKTRHMIEMARELSTRQLSFAITAKDVPARRKSETDEAYVDRAMEEGERLDLGTGDLSVPLMISVSAYAAPTLGPNGLIYALAVAAGSTISLYLLLQFVSKQKVFLPALPPICLGGMLALLLVKLAGL